MGEEDYAILVGINDYPELGATPTEANLQGPANDVDAIKAWLTDPAGGGIVHEDHIQIIKSQANGTAATPTSDEIEMAFGQLNNLARIRMSERKGSRIGRRLYIFVSGHGFSPGRQRGCLFSANASAKLGTFNVHATGWLNWLQDAGLFREFVLWMDCCMNRVSFLQPRDPQLPPLNSPDPSGSTFIAFAAQRPLKAVELAIPNDAGKIHGAFTWALLEGLKGAAADYNGRVTARSLADWLRNATSAHMTDLHRQDGDVAKEPEIIQEDAGLVFARGVARRQYSVEIEIPERTVGKSLQIWSGIPPRVEVINAEGPLVALELPPGLYLAEVPDAGLRQGFEVVSDARVNLTETGRPVKPPKEGDMLRLEIDPSDAGAEIFLVDARFSLVDGGTGKLSTSLPFGLFKIKTRIGRSLTQRIILLDDQSPALPPQQIARPASAVIPLVANIDDDAQWRDRQKAVLESIQTLNTAPAALMVMTRAADVAEVPQRNTVPWKEIVIVDAAGTPVITMDTDSSRSANDDSHACAVQGLAPGAYYMKQKLEDGPTIEQSLIVCASWVLEVYVLRRTPPGGHAPAARPRVSLMMRKPGLEPDTELEKIIETARLALADERRVLNAELEDKLLRRCTNPIGGLIGGHLLLVERERDPGRNIELLDTLVAQLREMLGPCHPDVAALGLQCINPELKRFGPLTGPPMFQRSWKLLADASQRGEVDFPIDAWKRSVAQTTLPPLLVWAAEEPLREAALASLDQSIFGEATLTSAGIATAQSRAARLHLPLSGFSELLHERLKREISVKHTDSPVSKSALTPLRVFRPAEWTRGFPSPSLGFARKFLMHGDSWFSIGALPPSALTTSIPQHMAFPFPVCALLYAEPGADIDTLVNLQPTSEWLFTPAFESSLKGRLAEKWDAILLSAGVGDLIQALGVSPFDANGNVLPRNQRLLLLPNERGNQTDPLDFVSNEGWARFEEYLEGVFQHLIDWRDAESSESRLAPVFLHSFSYVQPRAAGTGAMGDGWTAGPWLSSAFEKYAISNIKGSWRKLSDHLIDRLFAQLDSICTRYPNMHLVDLRTTLLPAAAETDGVSGDWTNELHPTSAGYRKLTEIYCKGIERVLSSQALSTAVGRTSRRRPVQRPAATTG